MLKVDFWKQDNWMDVVNLGISWDETVDIMKRFDSEVMAYTQKYHEKIVIIFAVWVNDSVTNKDENINAYSEEQFSKNYDELLLKAGKYTKNIILLGLTKADEKLVCPFPWSKTWKCFKNNRIIRFDSIIKQKAQENNYKFIEMFDLLNEDDLDDGIHPNTKWHKKIYEEVKGNLKGYFSSNNIK